MSQEENIRLFKKEVDSYFRNRGWINQELFHGGYSGVVIRTSYFVNSRFNQNIILHWTNKHDEWVLEHLQPFMKKYNINKKDIKFQ